MCDNMYEEDYEELLEDAKHPKKFIRGQKVRVIKKACRYNNCIGVIDYVALRDKIRGWLYVIKCTPDNGQYTFRASVREYDIIEGFHYPIIFYSEDELESI